MLHMISERLSIFLQKNGIIQEQLYSYCVTIIITSQQNFLSNNCWSRKGCTSIVCGYPRLNNTLNKAFASIDTHFTGLLFIPECS